jgi:hypothetical protein
MVHTTVIIALILVAVGLMYEIYRSTDGSSR